MAGKSRQVDSVIIKAKHFMINRISDGFHLLRADQVSAYFPGKTDRGVTVASSNAGLWSGRLYPNLLGTGTKNESGKQSNTDFRKRRSLIYKPNFTLSRSDKIIHLEYLFSRTSLVGCTKQDVLFSVQIFDLS